MHAKRRGKDAESSSRPRSCLNTPRKISLLLLLFLPNQGLFARSRVNCFSRSLLPPLTHSFDSTIDIRYNRFRPTLFSHASTDLLRQIRDPSTTTTRANIANDSRATAPN